MLCEKCLTLPSTSDGFILYLTFGAASSSPVVRRTRLSTIGYRAFPVAIFSRGLWNTLPPAKRHVGAVTDDF